MIKHVSSRILHPGKEVHFWAVGSSIDKGSFGRAQPNLTHKFLINSPIYFMHADPSSFELESILWFVLSIVKAQIIYISRIHQAYCEHKVEHEHRKVRTFSYCGLCC